MDTLKELPYDIKAEQAILGIMLVDKDATIETTGILKPEFFYSGENQIVYTAMVTLSTNGIPIDIITVKNELEKKGYKLYNVGDIVSIKIRTRMNGDRIDNIKLKKILTDRKIDKFQRNILPVILHNNNIIILADIKKSKKLDNLKTSRYVAIKKGE